jgi:hypothetical protein
MINLFDSLEQIWFEVILNISPLLILACCCFNVLTSSIKANDDVWYGGQAQAWIGVPRVGTKVHGISTNKSLWSTGKGA